MGSEPSKQVVSQPLPPFGHPPRVELGEGESGGRPLVRSSRRLARRNSDNSYHLGAPILQGRDITEPESTSLRERNHLYRTLHGAEAAEYPALTRGDPMRKTPLLPLVYLVALFVLIGCSAPEGAPRAASYATTSEAGSGDISLSRAPSEAAGEAASSPQDAVPPNLMANRQIIRRGSVTVRVKDIASSEKKVNALVATLGGYVENSSSTGLNTSYANVQTTVRVPVAKFDQLLDSMPQFGVVTERSINSEDVTTQIFDLDARLRMLRIKEERMITLLKREARIKEIIELEGSLANLRTEIEQLDASKRNLTGAASYSTLTITLTQDAVVSAKKSEEQGWARQTWGRAVESSMGLMRSLGALAIYLAVFAPFWIPALLGGYWLVKRVKAKPKA